MVWTCRDETIIAVKFNCSCLYYYYYYCCCCCCCITILLPHC